MRTQEERDEQTVEIGKALGIFATVMAAGAAILVIGTATVGPADPELVLMLVGAAAVVAAVSVLRRGERRTDTAWEGAPRLIGWGLLLAWVGLVASVLLAGASNTTYTQLEQGIRDGDVTSVTATPGMDGGGRGHARVELSWRNGWFAYTTTVVERMPGNPGRAEDGVTAFFDGSTVREDIARLDPDVQVVTVNHFRASDTVFDHAVPDWVLLYALLAWILTIAHLVGAPQTWRATKWAWFWLLGLAPPLGVLAYLALGGPTGLVGRPPEGSRRLTGGWAFLIAVLLGSTFFGAQR